MIIKLLICIIAIICYIFINVIICDIALTPYTNDEKKENLDDHFPVPDRNFPVYIGEDDTDRETHEEAGVLINKNDLTSKYTEKDEVEEMLWMLWIS